MRQRGGCDFIHVTNGDNIYHVDFFRHQLAVFNARPDVGSTAVDFSCHGLKRFQRVRFKTGKVDLGCMLVRPSAMRDMTFVLDRFGHGKRQGRGVVPRVVPRGYYGQLRALWYYAGCTVGRGSPRS